MPWPQLQGNHPTLRKSLSSLFSPFSASPPSSSSSPSSGTLPPPLPPPAPLLSAPSKSILLHATTPMAHGSTMRPENPGMTTPARRSLRVGIASPPTNPTLYNSPRGAGSLTAAISPSSTHLRSSKTTDTSALGLLGTR
ncbi:hypothetical protein HN51_013110 [Arachis hypogaea]